MGRDQSIPPRVRNRVDYADPSGRSTDHLEPSLDARQVAAIRSLSAQGQSVRATAVQQMLISVQQSVALKLPAQSPVEVRKRLLPQRFILGLLLKDGDHARRDLIERILVNTDVLSRIDLLLESQR